jgi:hypothetical protein
MSGTFYLPESLAVADAAVAAVLHMESGRVLPAHEVIGRDYDKAIQLRMALQESISTGAPLYCCPLCVVPVRIVSQKEKGRFFFRHDLEDGRCPSKTKGSLDERQISALKYDGVRESVAHQQMKRIVAESLCNDPDFSEVEIEPIWKGLEKNSRRRPDVRAVWKGSLPVAFEVQLSTTFLRVIAERRQFYLREGGLLIWVFKVFDASESRLTQDDIFYNNNRNAFVVSHDTLVSSKKNKALMLDCLWTEPVIEMGARAWVERSKRVGFSELTIERERQRVYFFDAEGAEQKVETGLAVLIDDDLRQAFHRFWLSSDQDPGIWAVLRDELLDKGIEVPNSPGHPDGPYHLLNTLYSAREGRPIGWGHAQLINVAHHVFDRYKPHLWAMRLMLAAHDQRELIRTQDRTGNWRNIKVKTYLGAWKKGDATYAPDRQWDELVCLLFPEISAQLASSPSLI